MCRVSVLCVPWFWTPPDNATFCKQAPVLYQCKAGRVECLAVAIPTPESIRVGSFGYMHTLFCDRSIVARSNATTG